MVCAGACIVSTLGVEIVLNTFNACWAGLVTTAVINAKTTAVENFDGLIILINIYIYIYIYSFVVG
jgi:hypothetical protein